MKPTTQGTRWADPQEIKNSPGIRKLGKGEGYNACGLPLIRDAQHIYVDNSDSHTLIFGSTGSKKTRLFGMPMINLVTLAGESFITTDPKGELYERTSGFAASKGYDIVVLNFRDMEKSSLWNPLSHPYKLYHNGNIDDAISLINDFLTTLAEPQRKTTNDSYWIEMGFAMALAFMLFFIETATEEQANISNFIDFFTSNSSVQATEALAKRTAEGSIASTNFNTILTNKEAEKTFACVASIVVSMFAQFTTRKTLRRVLSQNSFISGSIGKRKTAVYIIVPDERTSLHFLATLFIKQVYEALIHEAHLTEERSLPIRVNFLLDEFCNIPKIPDMPAMISAARSRNIRFFLMAQGMYQLRQKYDKDAETIKGNCDNWVFLTSREYALLEEISNLCGAVIYHDLNGNRAIRPLISVSELQRLSKEQGEALILQGRQYPYMANLPDIDDYSFERLTPAKARPTGLPQITPYSIHEVLKHIDSRGWPLPFSYEVYGQHRYYEEKKGA
ncbi:MAG: type IV secretory system conjugative DNA transfer family protein [Defluviitaleaceae bacterium]|nr:type IV secretory system conjugative DNA transfer family protein [Defluviitaleaceae bacterium]